MRDYEIVYIFRSSLASEAIEEKLERFHAILTGDGEGEITGSAHWGKRPFAYPIRKQKNGYYVVVQFASNAAGLSALERVLKLDDDVLRYLIVIAERPLPAEEEDAEAEETADAEETEGDEAAGEEETAADDESAAAAEEADEAAAGEEESGAEEAAEEAPAEEGDADEVEDASAGGEED